MKTDINTLRDSFDYSYYTFKESRDKAIRTEEYYHNRFYTKEQLSDLRAVGQPPQTFNLIKLFTRHLVGYYSKVLNDVTFNPVQMQDIPNVSLLQDVYNYINNSNNWRQLGNQIKRNGFLSGLFVEYLNVVYKRDTSGNILKDMYGRNIYEIVKESVPHTEILLDPMSKKLDYTDARFIHRFKWLNKEQIEDLFPNKNINYDTLESSVNHLNIRESEIEYSFAQGGFAGSFTYKDNYLIVHSIVRDGDKTWSIYWCGDTIIDKSEITYKEVKFPYTVVKLSDSYKAEYYGVFNDVLDEIDAVQQSLIQIQLNINSDKVFVNDSAVEDREEFTEAYKRVGSIIFVDDINGIRIDKLGSEIQTQFITIDKAFARIKQVLGISDAFLGMAFKYDTGRKVQLQQQATSVGLQYIDDALALFYKLDAMKVAKLVKQYYKATQVLNLVDERVGQKWLTVNPPIINPETGLPYYEQAYDPATGKPLYTEKGFPVVAPIHHPDYDLEFTDSDVKVVSIDYNDGEQDQIVLEQVINGNAGQMLMTVNPAGYARLTAMNIKHTKTRYSQDIAQIFEETAQMLTPQPQQQQTLGSGGGGSSQVGGLPNVQNRTNYIKGDNR